MTPIGDDGLGGERPGGGLRRSADLVLTTTAPPAELADHLLREVGRARVAP
jgi:hypothetical protein